MTIRNRKIDLRNTRSALLLKILWICICGWTVISQAEEPALWTNSLSPTGPKSELLKMAESGQANYDILLASQPTSVETKAAQELQKFLGMITGAEFQIRHEDSPKPSTRKFISVGNTEKLRSSGLADKYALPGDNGYVVAVKEGDVFLWGPKIRGVINAVYAILEEDIGCRWYTSNVTKIPHDENLNINIVSRSYTPIIKQRVPYYKDAFDVDWALRNRTSNPPMPLEWGGSFNLPHGVHTLRSLLPAGQYFKEHPEYYSEKEGIRSPTQPCMTNPDAIKIVAENIKRTIKENPASKVFSVSLNDGTGYCRCEKCLAIDKPNGWNPRRPDQNRAGSLIYFINGVAEIVERDYPDVMISTLAYLGTADAPITIKPRKNVAIRVCDDIHSWPMPLIDFVSSDQPESVRFRKLMEGWSKICDNIYIWEYTTCFSHYLCPLGNMNRIEPMVKYYLDHGVKGIMFQGNYTSLGGSRVPLRSWVLAKHLWNPQWKVQDLMRDFVTGMYGGAADEILNYYSMLDQIGLDFQTGKKTLNEMRRKSYSGPEGYSDKFALKAIEIFRIAELKANNPTILRRVKLEKLPILYLIAYNQYKSFTKDEIVEAIDELEGICKMENVTAFEEGVNGINDKIAYFRAKVEFDSPNLTWFKLDQNYKFKAITERTSDTDKSFAGLDVDDSKWEIINGWKEWDSQGYPGFSGTGWYRQKFKIPAEWSGKNKKLFLLIGGIDEQGVIFLNGKKIHEHTTASKKQSVVGLYKMKLMIPADEYIKAGSENLLVVKVMNGVGAGGLYRPIFLISSPTQLDPQVAWEYINSTNLK